jgi:Putative phage metallopeptidase
MRRRRRAVTRKKPPAYELIERVSIIGAPLYDLLQGFVDERPELVEARIALAWCTTWKADRDGHVTLGKCIKATQLHRELAPYDCSIVLNQYWWTDPKREELARQALLFHELCHLDVVSDPETGEWKRDERDRLRYRIRKHDVEEFHAVVARFGLWKRDLEQQYAAIVLHARQGFVPCEQCRETTHPGYVAVDETANTLRRCDCWLAWQARTAA